MTSAATPSSTCLLYTSESFLEELWTAELLAPIDGPDADARKLEISRAIMHENFTLGAPYQCCYTTEDRAGCAGGYLKSDMGERIWDDIENESMLNIVDNLLTLNETMRLREQMERMAPILSLIHIFSVSQSDSGAPLHTPSM